MPGLAKSRKLTTPRWPGSASSTIGTLTTAEVSAGSITRTGPGWRQWATTGSTTNPDGRKYICGNTASGITEDGSSPVSSWPSRTAAATASSPGSKPPPGKAGWPAWERRVVARAVSRMSGRNRPDRRRAGVPVLGQQHEHGAPPGAVRRGPGGVQDVQGQRCPVEPADERLEVGRHCCAGTSRRRRPGAGSTGRGGPSGPGGSPSSGVGRRAAGSTGTSASAPSPASRSRWFRSAPTTRDAADSGSVATGAVGRAQAATGSRRHRPADFGVADPPPVVRSCGRRTSSIGPSAAWRRARVRPRPGRWHGSAPSA